jgi:hypothetical protein
MLQRLTGQLPNWARTENPLLRYELGRVTRVPKTRQYVRAAGFIALILVLYWGGYLIATNFLQTDSGQNLTERLIAIVFWPTLVLQVLMQIVALSLTVNVVAEHKRRQTWDNLRATEGGAALAFRTHWAAVFYRLRPMLAVILLVRIILIFGILYDLTAFQGRYIDLLINGVIPDVSPIVAALLLAFLMTASLLLPFTTVGMDAALGLLISVSVQQRIYSVMTQMIIIILRVGLVIGLTYAATQFIRGQLALPDGAAWALMGVFSALGDWGLSFLHLGFYSEIWATIPYAIFMGIGLLLFTMAQSALAELVLALAIRRAERNG